MNLTDRMEEARLGAIVREFSPPAPDAIVLLTELADPLLTLLDRRFLPAAASADPAYWGQRLVYSDPRKRQYGGVLHEHRQQLKGVLVFETAIAEGIHKNVNDIFLQRKDLKGKVVVDLACGDGRTTYLLRNLGAKVLPYDILPEYYKLEDKAQYSNLNEPLPIESESVDMVILQEVMEHLPNQLFALQEINRILKPGGELFMTTPNYSAIVSKLAYMCFESEFLRGTPISAVEGVWGEDSSGTKKYYAHLFLIGAQRLRTLAMLAGFKSMSVMKSDISTSSAALMLAFYPIIFFVSLRAFWRARKKNNQQEYRSEKLQQFLLNISPRTLTNKFLIASLVK